jgi:hypothetical protein
MSLVPHSSGASDKKVLLWEMGVAMIVKRYEGHMNTVSAVTLVDYDADKFRTEADAAQGEIAVIFLLTLIFSSHLQVAKTLRLSILSPRLDALLSALRW